MYSTTVSIPLAASVAGIPELHVNVNRGLYIVSLKILPYNCRHSGAGILKPHVSKVVNGGRRRAYLMISVEECGGAEKVYSKTALSSVECVCG